MNVTEAALDAHLPPSKITCLFSGLFASSRKFLFYFYFARRFFAFLILAQLFTGLRVPLAMWENRRVSTSFSTIGDRLVWNTLEK